MIPHLDGLGESAAIMGAVNCVVKRDDRFIGENTDGKGFLESLKSVISPEGQHIVLLGAGGAARAIAVELALAGAGKISVINRSPDRGKELCQLINDQLEVVSSYTPWEKSYKITPDTDVLVNATSIGLYDGTAPLAIDLETLNPSTIVADVIFNPAETWLIRNARRIGCTALDGLGMIVNQGITSVAYWTGLRPDQSIMRNAVEKALRLE